MCPKWRVCVSRNGTSKIENLPAGRGQRGGCRNRVERDEKKRVSPLTSLQYNPHALQLSSSLSPRRHSGVCVAPQLAHSLLTPPGAELPGLCELVLLRVGGVAEGPWRAAALVAGGPPAVAFPFPLFAFAFTVLVAAPEAGTGGGPITWSSRTMGRLEETGCTSVG